MNALSTAWAIVTIYLLVVLWMAYVALVDGAMQELMLSQVEGALAEGPRA